MTPGQIQKDKHAIAAYHPNVYSPSCMNIFLDILDSEYFDDKIDQILATVSTTEPFGKAELMFKSVSNRQYKKILPEINILKQLRFRFETDRDLDFDLSDVKVVLHFSN